MLFGSSVLFGEFFLTFCCCCLVFNLELSVIFGGFKFHFSFGDKGNNGGVGDFDL